MRLLGAFLRLLVAGALGAPPAPVRSGGGAGGGSERGQPGGSPAPPVPPPGVAVAAGAAPPGAGWRGARRRVPPCRPRQRPPFPPCRPRRRGGPPARSRPVSWQRAAAGAPAGRGRQPGEGCAQGRGRGGGGGTRCPPRRYPPRSPVAMPWRGWGSEQPVPPQPAPGACGHPERSAALARACRPSGAGLRGPGQEYSPSAPLCSHRRETRGDGCPLRLRGWASAPAEGGRGSRGSPAAAGCGGRRRAWAGEGLPGRRRKSPSG